MLTTVEASVILGLQPKTVTRYIGHGLIAAEKKGRDYLIASDELERFQRERRKAGRPRKKTSFPRVPKTASKSG